jgi:flagellar basal body P-ring protein FlgI
MILAIAQVPAFAAPPGKKNQAPPPKVDETVGDLAVVLQGVETRVEGVGLVVGLDNTGGDPPESWYRSQLVEEMTKEGIDHASKMLADPQYAMVIVRMTIPAGASPDDHFDVEIESPPGSSTKSLSGGRLLKTRLRPILMAGGAPKTGSEFGFALGPIMVGTAENPNDLKSGRVLGGGRVKKETPFTMVIKDKHRSIRTAAIIQNAINQRFPQRGTGISKGTANGKSDSHLEIKIPSNYHQNQLRYFRVVQLLQLVDSPDLRVQRQETWGKELLDPKTSGIAALKLESLGISAQEKLEEGLKSPHPQVRFLAAEALAYLDNPKGAEVLSETAIQMPQFRAYALAALASMDQPVAHIKLRQLMDANDIEVRYGAFNALRVLDPRDPRLGRIDVMDQPKVEKPDEEFEGSDAMALSIARTASTPRVPDHFSLYVVDSDGPPVVHVSRTRRSEIVLFGRDQALETPVVLGTGNILLNAAEKDDQIEISKIVMSRFGNNDVKLRTSLDLVEVIRRVANLGATYPEIVSILDAANRQKNLAGTLIVDAVPPTDPEYFEAAIFGKDTTVKSDPKVEQTSTKPMSRFRKLFRAFGGQEETVAEKKPAPSPAKPEDAEKVASAAEKDKDAAASDEIPPKKDDGLKKASQIQEEEPAPAAAAKGRPRLLNWLKRSGD